MSVTIDGGTVSATNFFNSPRKWLSALLRTHSWLPVVVALLSAGLFMMVAVLRLPPSLIIGTGLLLAITFYAYGYTIHALKYVTPPQLTQFHRKQYEQVWDSLAASSWEARWAASGEQREIGLRRSAERALHNILSLAKIGLRDDVLEIGCGVGRIALELAPRCGSWTGGDISGNMLVVAGERLAQLQNVRLVKLDHVGLAQFQPSSFDVVYSTNMFDHLDETDRWLYIRDAFRVLRSGGRLYVDNTDLESDAGWSAFANGASAGGDKERPPYLPTPATAAEYAAYARHAGFQQIEIYKRTPLLILIAVKPGSDREGTEP